MISVIGPSFDLSDPGAFEHDTTIDREEDVVPLPLVALSQGNDALRLCSEVFLGGVDDVVLGRVIRFPHGAGGRARCLEGLVVLWALLIVSVDERLISLFHDSEG